MSQISIHSKARRRLFAAIALTGVLPLYLGFSLFLSMSGGLLGPAMLWLLPLLAWSASWLGLLAWRSLKSSRAWRAAAAGVILLTAPAGLFSAFFEIRSELRNPVLSLAPGLSSSLPFRETQIVYRTAKGDFLIRDPGNSLRFRYGPPPVSVAVRDGLRIVIFDQAVNLCSWTDSISMDEGGMDIGGGSMGARVGWRDSPFQIDPAGTVTGGNLK